MSALTVTNLRKSFGGLRVTKGVNLNVAPVGPDAATSIARLREIVG